MNIYLIASESIRLIDEEISKILKNNTNIDVFDMNAISMEDLLNEANYLSLFDDKRYIIAKNASLFGADSNKKSDSELLLKYLEKPNDKTILIFTYNGNPDSRKKIVKIISEKYKYINTGKLSYNDMIDRVRLLVKKDNFTIDTDTINYIINSCLNNYDLIYNEIEKIKLYYAEPCKFDINDVKKIVSKSIEENNFKFVDYVIEYNLEKAFKMLNDFSILKIEPISLLNLLAREYRLMHMVKTLYDDKKPMSYIAKELGLQSWQIDKLLKNCFNYDYETLENNLILLNECDLEMKSIYFNKYSILKAYILKMAT